MLAWSPPDPLKGESKDDVDAISEALARHLLDEIDKARIGKAEGRGSVRSSVREVCPRDAIVGSGALWSIAEDS